MVAATGAVGVKINAFDAVILQITARGAIGFNAARRGDMVGGNRVAQHGQNARAVNILYRFRLNAHLIKERRQANVGGIILPVVGIRAIHFNRLPLGCPFKHLGVLFTEHLR